MKYKLFSEDYIFDTGRNANNDQIVIGIQTPNIVVLQFSDEGELQNINKTPVDISDDTHLYDIYSDIYNELFLKIKTQLGFVSAPICILKFFLEQDEIGIQDFPDHFLDYLNNKNDETMYDLEQRESYEKLIPEWKMKNNFVFFWCEEYYIDGETGEIESS